MTCNIYRAVLAGVSKCPGFIPHPWQPTRANTVTFGSGCPIPFRGPPLVVKLSYGCDAVQMYRLGRTGQVIEPGPRIDVRRHDRYVYGPSPLMPYAAYDADVRPSFWVT